MNATDIQSNGVALGTPGLYARYGWQHAWRHLCHTRFTPKKFRGDLHVGAGWHGKAPSVLVGLEHSCNESHSACRSHMLGPICPRFLRWHVEASSQNIAGPRSQSKKETLRTLSLAPSLSQSSSRRHSLSFMTNARPRTPSKRTVQSRDRKDRDDPDTEAFSSTPILSAESRRKGMRWLKSDRPLKENNED